MEYAKDYPCLYGARGYGFIVDSKTKALIEVIKLGTSYHIANRKSGYSTAWVQPPVFDFVIILEKDSISPQDLYKLDAEFNIWFCLKGHASYYINNGGGTEFYNIACPTSYLELLKEFLQEKNLPIKTVVLDDPYPIRHLTLTEKEELEQETITTQKIRKSLSLEEKVFRTFLPKGALPRRIQKELWSIFQQICEQKDPGNIYKGIVQWPTGTGKTIAMLSLIILAAERCKRLGTIYRGLLVSPKNDIFNTITSAFNKLSEFGITLHDGSEGKLSKLTIPPNQHLLVMACPQSLLNYQTGMRNLPAMTHIHYDEVHRITGELYFNLLKDMLIEWKTEFLTGTSATPKTSDPEQHRKLAELFGDPYTLLHRCEVHEAVKEGLIAIPRFRICITPKMEKGAQSAYVKAFVRGVRQTIEEMKAVGLWRGGKVIAYLRSINEAKAAMLEAQTIMPDASVYIAVGNPRNDKAFLAAPADGSTRILFACERYREGSDIKGIDMTAVLIGNTISAYILIQIQGRALRKDCEEKEGWCMIMSPCEEGETEQDVFERISLDILTFLGDSKPLVRKDIETYVDTYFGEVEVNGVTISKQETVDRVQAAYVRREYKAGRMNFEKIRKTCTDENIKNIAQYNEVRVKYSFPEEPWKDRMSAYDFFHPENTERMNVDTFRSLLVDNKIFNTESYTLWNSEKGGIYPSVEDCVEGYFPHISNFQELLPVGRRRR